jgi:hypothetical protein
MIPPIRSAPFGTLMLFRFEKPSNSLLNDLRPSANETQIMNKYFQATCPGNDAAAQPVANLPETRSTQFRDLNHVRAGDYYLGANDGHYNDQSNFDRLGEENFGTFVEANKNRTNVFLVGDTSSF